MTYSQTKVFKRYVKEEFIEKLNKQNWWNNISKDRDLFVGIRDGYINIYYHGNSLVRLSLSRSRKIRGSTHRAYLQGITSLTSKEIISEDGEFREPVSPQNLLDIEQIKKQANAHFGIDPENPNPDRMREKSAIQKFLLNEPNIVDVEIAVSKQRSAKPLLNINRNIPRIDLVQLQQNGERFQLDFVEVKYITNKDLRSNSEPKVVGQLTDYLHLLADEEIKKEIIYSYGNVMKNLASLGLTDNRPMPLVREFTSNPNARLHVNPSPKLLVVWEDDSQLEKAPNWEKHRKSLEKLLVEKKINTCFKKV